MAKLKEDLKILIVDDSIETINVMRLFLKNKGLKNVLHCEDGETGASIIEREYKDLKPVQVIFLDLNMPTMSGYDFLEQIRSNPNYDDVLIIITTAEDNKDKVSEVVKNKVDGYLLKPLTADKIFSKIVDSVKKARRLA
ncbi:MAG: response regulator [Bdellovibrionales bacterium]|nr:response regulator [Bdellovibrionales bacterium]